MRFSNSILFLGLWLMGQCWLFGETSYPEPSISVHPSQTVALGGTVNIRCKKEDSYNQMPEDVQIEFYLVKIISSNLDILRNEVADLDEVVFSIVNAAPSDAGIYCCLYCYKRHNCQAWSEYSNSISINIREPNINAEQFHPKSSTSVNASEKTPNGVNSRAIIWAGSAAGSLILILLLLLVAFVLYRKRKRGSIAHKRTQPLPMKETNQPLEPDAEGGAEDNSDGVSYAVLNHYSLKRQEQAKHDSIPESCVYASVANGRTRSSQ